MSENGALVQSPCPDCGELVWSLPEHQGSLRCSSCGRKHFGCPPPTGSRRPMYVRRPKDPTLPLYRDPPDRT